MPGRQAHGRPLLGASGANGKKNKRSKARANQKALNAFAIASDQFSEKQKRTPRNRELDAQLGAERTGKHGRHDGDDDDEDFDEDSDEDEGRPRKMRRGADRPRNDGEEEIEYGSDSSGNEWRVGVGEDDDSEIDSDEAFGESDEERFENYKFPKSKKADDDDDDDDEDLDDADGASLGSDAIDLAAALDMSSDDEEEEAGQEGDDSGEYDSSDGDSSSGEGSSDEDEDQDDDVSESGVNAWVKQFSGVKDADEEESSATKKPKLNLQDLGLVGIKDPQLKKSVKLMGKEEKSGKPKKLDVPLETRQQAKLDRSVAYDKTKDTLDRWTETVKQNRRADHLVFPLPQNDSGVARHDNTELQPINQKKPGNELESTILAIMEESGLGPSAQKESRKGEDDDDLEGQYVSRSDLKALWGEKRRQRELKSREDKRAKRIKKIKSKAYHRVHRKQKERDSIKEHEAAVAAGEIDSDEEREAQDRQRAMERMGARHRESKWAKMSKKNAAWDDDVRAGLTDMARRDEELRRRIDGRPGKSNGGDDDSEDDESDYSGDSDDGDERKRILQQLNDASDEDSQPRSKLMNMDFMKRAEAAKKQANDAMMAEIRRELASEDEDNGVSEEETEEVGRKRYGQPTAKNPFEKQQKPSKKTKLEETKSQAGSAETVKRSTGLSQDPITSSKAMSSTSGGAWSQPAESGSRRKQRGKASASASDVLDLGADSVAVAAAPTPTPRSKPAKAAKSSKASVLTATANDDGSEGEADHHLPVQFREQELLDKAFGGLDVVADFEQEKAELAEEDDDKVVDNTLPGWGSWVGDGVSAREKSRHTGRFLTKQEGVKKKGDRRDTKLKDAIINEKRIKKNEKYMASQLPHPFESRLQYERSLRLPVGPEWMTKQSFQEATKPRVMIKQGVIAPMSRPTH